MKRVIFIYMFFISFIVNAQVTDLSLNGIWDAGLNRIYSFKAEVPGITLDPTKPLDGKLWYKRTVKLPKGDWSNATLVLMGARFSPEVYINGEKVSQKNGGMAATFHSLNHKAIKPNSEMTIEISLTSLSNLSTDDASYIPKTDQWRSNITSSLWDDVYIHFHNEKRIQRIVPYYNTDNKTIDIRCDFENLSGFYGLCDFEAKIYDLNGVLLLSTSGRSNVNSADIHFNYTDVLTEWSTDNPQLYNLIVQLKDGEKVIDCMTQSIGIKVFSVKDKQFSLNGEPCKIRGGTVVWPRWMRTDEGRELGYDTDWFTENVIIRLKEHGANMLRFHLGVPPRRLLELCDKYGLLVQYEWSFFHGMSASLESLLEQLPGWFDLSLRHPSIANYHPYNETEGEELKTMWRALDSILPNYPPIVLEERDVIHIHKYWWSIFENVGVYYDDADQFDRAIMVDEFGGNYLDENGDIGGYPALMESNMRFLGRANTVEERLNFQAVSNARIAEYWRRINAAGIAPFVIAGSKEDGNHWFMDKLIKGNPKPVWKALTASFSPRSVSLDIWDKNFVPNEKVTIPLFFFNDTESNSFLESKLSIIDKWGKIYHEQKVKHYLKAYEHKSVLVEFKMPEKVGEYTICAELIDRPSEVKYPIVSSWDIRVFKAKAPCNLINSTVATFDGEVELVKLLDEHGVVTGSPYDKNIKLLIGSLNTWQLISKGDIQTKKIIEDALQRGVSVLLLDVGERNLGQGYPKEYGNLGNLQGLSRIDNPKVTEYEIIDGVKLICTEAAEPESHLHADRNSDKLWNQIPREYTWLWNGYRGGLIVPASNIEITGLSQDAYIEIWKARGADIEKIKEEDYYAYDLQGFYRFSAKMDDKTTEKELRDYVTFLVEDAPALTSAINPRSPIRKTNLSEEFKNSKSGKAKNITVLANAGKNLTKTPVFQVGFGEQDGKLLISQLLTAGRLDRESSENTKYGIRYDEVAVQMVLNMIDGLIE